MNKILTTTSIFSRSSYPKGLSKDVYAFTWRRKSKMASFQTEIPYIFAVEKIEIKFQGL